MKNARNFLNRYKRLRLVSLPTFAIGLLVLISPVLADNSNPESGLAGIPDDNGDRSGFSSDIYDEPINVTGVPVMRRQDGKTKHGFPIEIIERKQRVSYADLDLSREQDVAVFELRVEAVARQSCEALVNRQSIELDGWTVRSCTSVAVNRSLQQLQTAIAANQ